MNQVPPLPSSAPLLLRALFKRAQADGGAGGELPCTSFQADRIDEVRLARYNQLLGFPGGAVPLTFHYLLAQRAQLATMLRSGFPFRIAGMIHVANELAAHGAFDPARPIVLQTSARVAPPQANGALHVLFQTVGQQDGRDVFSCASDYLAVRGKRGARPGRMADVPVAAIGHWALDGASGRRYAAVSGDWNPIHLWPWSARLMGLRAPVIHGMHTVAKCCAALQNTAGRSLTAISARFTAPVALPGQVTLSADLAARTYTAASAGRAAVVGSYALG